MRIGAAKIAGKIGDFLLKATARRATVHPRCLAHHLLSFRFRLA